MKILGGKLKGRNFYTHADIRPSQNIHRKTLFDILGQDLEGMSFLDIFAGSGSIGLEAISFGATRVGMIEKNEKVFNMLRENVLMLTSPEECSIDLIHADAFPAIKNLASKGEKYQIVFLDPPYKLDLAKKALKTIGTHDILTANCQLVIQHERREILPKTQGRFNLYREKQFGDTVLSFYR